MLGALEVGAAIQMGSHKSEVEGDNNIPWPASFEV